MGELCLDGPAATGAVPAASGEPDDAEVVAAMADRDSTALATLYSRHGQALFSYLLRLAGDRGVAEEILQDTLLAAWRSAGGFEGRSAVRTWLFGIGRRQTHNRLRGKRLEWADLTEAADMSSGDPGPEAAALAGADREAIVAAMGRISSVHAEVLGLAFVDGMAYVEIAKILAIPVGTVKSRLSHARRALAAELKEKR